MQNVSLMVCLCFKDNKASELSREANHSQRVVDCRVLVTRSRDCGFEPHWRHCFVSLSKALYPLLSSTQEEASHHDGKIVNWDVKNKKQSLSIHV